MSGVRQYSFVFLISMERFGTRIHIHVPYLKAIHTIHLQDLRTFSLKAIRTSRNPLVNSKFNARDLREDGIFAKRSHYRIELSSATIQGMSAHFDGGAHIEGRRLREVEVSYVEDPTLCLDGEDSDDCPASPPPTYYLRVREKGRRSGDSNASSGEQVRYGSELHHLFPYTLLGWSRYTILLF